jgi:plastocyanin
MWKNWIFLSTIFLFWISCTDRPPKTTHKLYNIEIKQMQFQPANLTVNKHDTVVFINKDMVEHNVTEESNKLWGSPALGTGKSWTLVVKESSNYYCSIHPVMKGILTVQIR